MAERFHDGGTLKGPVPALLTEEERIPADDPRAKWTFIADDPNDPGPRMSADEVWQWFVEDYSRRHPDRAWNRVIIQMPHHADDPFDRLP